MIIESVLTGGINLINFVFNLLPTVPQLNDTLLNSFWYYVNTLFNNLNLLSCFVRVSTIKMIVPLLIFLLNFEFIYSFAIWVANKIPFIDLD